MQMVLHIPDNLAERFRQVVPSPQQNDFLAKALEDALSLAEDPIYLSALAVEQDEALNAEMKEWHDACIADGIREHVDMNGDIDATR
jgi:hypothetical protein